MFTGIIEELGTVKSIVSGGRYTQIMIHCKKIIEDLKIGDSISVNGVCLTASKIGDSFFIADIMPETIRKSALKKLGVASLVNLERALTLSSRLGGHMVSGHIDGEGVITKIEREKNAVWLTIDASADILRYIILKGSVAIDGTSLTVAHIDNCCFKVSLIPLTAKDTILGNKKENDYVNIECDMIGKYVEKLLGQKENGISIDLLRENGFA